MKKLLGDDGNDDSQNGRCGHRLHSKRSHYGSLGVVRAIQRCGWLGDGAAEPEWHVAVSAIVVASGTEFFFALLYSRSLL